MISFIRLLLIIRNQSHNPSVWINKWGMCSVQWLKSLHTTTGMKLKLNPIKVIRAWLLPKLNSVHHALCLAGSDALGIRHCRKQRWSKLSFFKYFFLIGSVNAAGQKSILHAATYKSDKSKEP
jgi:hypothetical protein